jgi:hypothetical protein
MEPGTTPPLRLGLAALVSGAAAGLMTILAIVCAGLLLGGAAIGNWVTVVDVGAGLVTAIVAGIVVAAPPALLAGAAMCALGRRFEAARRTPAWAAAGAATGGWLWAALTLAVRILLGAPGPLRPDAVLLAAALIGAVAALAFRAVARPSRSEAR